MNYGWPVNTERERERSVLGRPSSSPWAVEVSRCERCHADGDPGGLQPGRARAERAPEITCQRQEVVQEESRK